MPDIFDTQPTCGELSCDECNERYKKAVNRISALEAERDKAVELLRTECLCYEFSAACTRCKQKHAFLASMPIMVVGHTTVLAPHTLAETNNLESLVAGFANALLEKLAAAEKKYNYEGAWKKDDWQDSLIIQLNEHVAKGDPLDVAAYCAFAWHHKWSLRGAVQEDGEDEVSPEWIKDEWGWTCVPDYGFMSFYRDSCRLESIGQSNHWRLYLLDYKVDKVITTRSQFRSLMTGLGIEPQKISEKR